MKRIGLTGGIASGKSLISQYFQDRDILILDADKIYKNLLKTNNLLYNELKKAFHLKELDLQELAGIVFNDKEKLSLLNQIAHPYVIQAFSEQLKRLDKTEEMVVLDIPLLYEAKMEPFCDQIICVYVDKETQITRLMERDNLTEEDALKRIESQMSLDEKCLKSDYVIDNSKDFDYTYKQFKEIYQKLRED
jgi:dephospho-CoA kinase